ncbi:hypothetical protein JTE90_023462 [Oedothorax gibbosus]|uniref:Uncharacterized protein n=1 Tax=Oedothorax gibbosus TaxID=931172 RepID=A0AAV6TMI0_9ARAC|nr:hypothetical protein JTE90_023462 [Oedothorax gibbosus]
MANAGVPGSQELESRVHQDDVVFVFQAGKTKAARIRGTVEIVVTGEGRWADEVECDLDKLANLDVDLAELLLGIFACPHGEVEGWKKERLEGVYPLPWGPGKICRFVWRGQESLDFLGVLAELEANGGTEEGSRYVVRDDLQGLTSDVEGGRSVAAWGDARKMNGAALRGVSRRPKAFGDGGSKSRSVWSSSGDLPMSSRSSAKARIL